MAHGKPSKAKKENDKSLNIYVGLLVLICLVTGCVYSPPAYSVSSSVQAEVCNSLSTSFEINSPSEGAVSDASPIAIGGSLSQISQIDISIDGNYSGTVAIDSGATEFLIDVAIPEGTHLIELTAIDSCTSNTITDNITLTYDPSLNPGTDPDPEPDPDDVPPVNPGQGGGDGTVTTGDEAFARPTITEPGDGSIDVVSRDAPGLLLLFTNFLNFLDITIPSETMYLDIVRQTLFFLGVILLILAKEVISLLSILHLRGGFKMKLKVYAHEVSKWDALIIRLIGLILLLLMLFGL